MSPSLHPAARVALVLILLSPLALALRARGPAGGAIPPPEPTGAPRPGLAPPVLGFAINAHHIGDLPLYLRSVDAIRDLGASTLMVVTPMFQRKVDSDRIRCPRALCPTDDQLRAILNRGRTLGMSTILMPIVLIENPADKEWRGLICPDDWDTWWASYEAELSRFVEIARTTRVDMLAVGSELNSTEDQIDRWAGLIRRVRDRYDGTITYSANWDRFDRTSIWSLVDVMSVSSYFELERDRPGAPVEDLVRAWKPVREALRAEAERWGKPLLLSEIGYPSLPWANAHPWNYVAENDDVADHAAQARSWRAFFRAWSDDVAAGRVLGFCGYRWDPYHDGDAHDTGYGVKGKEAYDIVAEGLRAIRRRAGGG